jgi:hypothetical protein
VDVVGAVGWAVNPDPQASSESDAKAIARAQVVVRGRIRKAYTLSTRARRHRLRRLGG